MKYGIIKTYRCNYAITLPQLFLALITIFLQIYVLRFIIIEKVGLIFLVLWLLFIFSSWYFRLYKNLDSIVLKAIIFDDRVIFIKLLRKIEMNFSDISHVSKHKDNFNEVYSFAYKNGKNIRVDRLVGMSELLSDVSAHIKVSSNRT